MFRSCNNVMKPIVILLIHFALWHDYVESIGKETKLVVWLKCNIHKKNCQTDIFNRSLGK